MWSGWSKQSQNLQVMRADLTFVRTFIGVWRGQPLFERREPDALRGVISANFHQTEVSTLPEQHRKTRHVYECDAYVSADTGVVLVVEDEVLIRLDVAEELRVSGYSVFEASSAEEALDLLAAGLQVDVIFSDFRLLGTLDGWQLRMAVERQYPGPSFILTSAQDPPSEAKNGTVPFVPKPYQAADVADLISSLSDSQRDENGSP